MKKSFLIGLGIGILIYAAAGIIRTWSQMEARKTIHETLLEKVEALQRLELVKYRIKDVMVLEKGSIPLLTKTKALLVISGEAYGCIDLSSMEERIRISGDTVFIKLPRPQVCNYRLNHDETRLYDLNMSLLDIAMDKDEKIMDNLYRDAQNRILQEALKSGILEDTRRKARDFLSNLVSALGFQVIVFDPEGQ